VENGQIKPAFGVYAELIRLGDTFAVVGGPPGALNQKGAWIYFFTGASPGAYAWGSAPKARVLAIRDPLGNFWRQGRDERFPNRVVWQSPNAVYLGVDADGTVYFAANTNPPQWQRLGKTPGALANGDPRGSDARSGILFWGDPANPSQHIAYRWSVTNPVTVGGATLEAGYLQGDTFVSQVRRNWRFTGALPPDGYTNGRGERELYAAMYGEVPANFYGRLYEQQWGTVSKTKLEYRPAAPFGVETKLYREGLEADYTLLRHKESDGDKKFNVVEMERPRLSGQGVSRERVWLSAHNGQPVLREFFEWRDDRQHTWQERYEYNYPADALALTGYVDRQGNYYRWEYEQRAVGAPWNPQNPEQETVLRHATDPTNVKVSLEYGESYTLPPWQVVRQNPPTVPLIRVHHSGSPPEEKLRISLSTLSTPRQHFTISDINPNNNTRALRRRLSHKPTSLPTNSPSRAANKHPNTYTNHNQHIPAAEPTRHQRHPKHPRPLPTKPLLHPHPRPRPRPTYRTRRQVRQPIPHILRPCAPKHHQSTPQPIPKRLPSKRHLLTRPRRTQRRERTRPTPPQRTEIPLRVDAHQRMPPVALDCPKQLRRPQAPIG
jgi:hypothetical protein